jgi:hypothetical protein
MEQGKRKSQIKDSEDFVAISILSMAALVIFYLLYEIIKNI